MKYTYQALPPKTFDVAPDGDYLLEIVDAANSMSQGAKTRGADVLTPTFRIAGGADFDENLIFHPSCIWKVDAFVKCFGLVSKPGESADLNPENLKGRFGWARVKKVMMTNADGTPYILRSTNQPGYKNEIAVFYTDKEVPPRRPVTADVPAWEKE